MLFRSRSDVVVADNRGDKIGPVVQSGKGSMPAFHLSAVDLESMVAYIHSQKTKFEADGGGRRSVDVSDLATGNAEAGRAYFGNACGSCHSATGDLAGVGKKYKGLELVQRMLYPSGRPAPARPKATVTLASGQTFAGTLVSDDEFSLTVQNASNDRQTLDRKSTRLNSSH